MPNGDDGRIQVAHAVWCLQLYPPARAIRDSACVRAMRRGSKDTQLELLCLSAHSEAVPSFQDTQLELLAWSAPPGRPNEAPDHQRCS